MERFLFFSVEAIRCGIPLDDALAMIRMVGITPHPVTKKGEIGTIDLHGEILPVYSLRYLFGFKERRPLLSDNLIIIQIGLEKAALWVDKTYIIQKGEMETEPRFTSEHLQTMIPGLRILRSDFVIIFDLIDFFESAVYSPTRLADIIKPDKNSIRQVYHDNEMRDYPGIEKELEERARELAFPQEITEKPPLIEVIRFNLTYQEYAVDMKYIREVIQTSEITPVPGTPEFIAGICSVRGEIISLVDLRILLSIQEKGLTDLNRVIVLTDKTTTFGILADQITGIGTIKSDEIQPCPAECTSAWRQYCTGTLGSLTVLDAAALLTDPRMIIDDSEA